jgi:hypothetical protein
MTYEVLIGRESRLEPWWVWYGLPELPFWCRLPGGASAWAVEPERVRQVIDDQRARWSKCCKPEQAGTPYAVLRLLPADFEVRIVKLPWISGEEPRFFRSPEAVV